MQEYRAHADLEVLDLSLVDAEVRGVLARPLEVVRAGTKTHLRECPNASAGPVSVEPWYDVTASLSTCCELILGEDDDPVTSSGLEFVWVSLATKVHSRFAVTEMRHDVEVAAQAVPALAPLLGKARTRLTELEAEYEAWLSAHGAEALELHASWVQARHEGLEVAPHQQPGARTALPGDLGAEHAELLRFHAQRARCPDPVVVRARGERRERSLLGPTSAGPTLQDAVADLSAGTGLWLVPGSLLPMVEARSEGFEHVVLTGVDEATAEALLVLLEESPMSLTEALEVAREL